MRLFDTVAIVGTGLIGGSVALSLKKHGLCRTVIGYSRRAQSLTLARAKKAVDRTCLSLEGIRDADLVVLAAPVSTIVAQARRIHRIIRPDCVVMDVASTKETVVRVLHPLFTHYVATHPLAGSEKKGIAHARADLFLGSLCLLTPVRGTDPKALALVQSLWKKIGCRIEKLDPRTHDRILGFVSHLPHVAAFALINCVPEQYLRFCPPSLKDMTRIAASDPALWQDVLTDNRLPLAQTFTRFSASFAAIASAVRRNDRAGLIRLLRAAQKKREALS